jgi:imidazolonepropionase-like amidohydrolase
MKTKSSSPLIILLLALIWSVSALQAQDAKETILFTNVKVFNGVDEKLLDADVLVEGNLIKQVAKGIKAPKGTIVIDGKGSVLMPGLIDAHWHTMYIGLPLSTLENGDMIEAAARAVPKAEGVLMRGFTTVRDLGGPS